MCGAVEVDARDPVRPTEASDVVLRGLDPQAAGIVLVHRTGAVDGQDDVLVHLRDPTVVDRWDVRQGDVRRRDAPRGEREAAIAGGREGRRGRGAERDGEGEMASGNGGADGRIPNVIRGLERPDRGGAPGIAFPHWDHGDARLLEE